MAQAVLNTKRHDCMHLQLPLRIYSGLWRSGLTTRIHYRSKSSQTRSATPHRTASHRKLDRVHSSSQAAADSGTHGAPARHIAVVISERAALGDVFHLIVQPRSTNSTRLPLWLERPTLHGSGHRVNRP